MTAPEDLKRLKELAKKLKVRVTKNVNGRRVYLTQRELQAAIDRKKKNEIKDEIKEIIETSKVAVENAKNEFFNASNDELENVFFNADDTPFNLRNDFENAIKKKDGKVLIEKAMRDLEVKGVDKSVMSAMKRDAIKTANYIRDLIKSGKIAKALFTISMLFATYKLYQNPTFVDRTLLNEVRKVPFMKPVLSDPRKGKIGWLFSVAGFDPTKKEQGIYEFGMSNALDDKIPGRSVAGIGASYLTMVILSLVSVLPYDSTKGTSMAALKLIFKLTAQYAPTVGKIIVDNFVSRKMTAQSRAQGVLTMVPQLIRMFV
jgi:hypothetical protein